MKNLEQIRAAGALEPASNLDRSAVNKLPALILTNGLLAATAYCLDGGGENRADMKEALDATAKHLARRKLIDENRNTPLGMLQDLSGRDSHHLQRATAEALAFIGYLKRFSKKKEGEP